MGALNGVVQGAAPGVLGVDVDSPLSLGTARTLYGLGYRFCARYLSLSAPQRSGDLSAEEASSILDAGLALVPVQHVLMPGWSPSRELGAAHGRAALLNAQQIGIPPGVNVWCDLEGIRPGTDFQAIIDYCYAWYVEVSSGGHGYIPGLYVAYDVYLSSQQLHDALPFEHYWSAPCSTPIARRGSQMIQLLPLGRSLPGVDVRVDVDVTQEDAMNNSLQWLAPAGSSPR